MTGYFLKVVTGFLIVTASAFSSQIISGSASMPLSGPITDEQNKVVRKKARIELKKSILSWLGEQQGITIDTLNTLDNFAVEQYIDSCAKFTKEEIAFRGKIIDATLLLTYESAEKALQNHNLATDTKATESWKKFLIAQSSSNFNNSFIEGIRTIAAANAHFGPPLVIPESKGKSLIDEARLAVQEMLNRIKVSSSEVIIEGNPGSIVSKPPILTVVIDSTPLPGIWFTGKFQNATELFSKVSDDKGEISLADFRIPFVTNGALMYIYIDLGKLIGSPTLIQSKNFGLRLRNSQDQTFIVKINRPSYKLDYKANSVGNITLPSDFSNEVHIKKFLHDSCYMQESSADIPANLNLTLQLQVSDYDYDETEEVGIKTTVYISIKGQDYNPPINSENTIVFEKRYERSTKVPYGLYFWEANIKVREIIRTIIDQL